MINAFDIECRPVHLFKARSLGVYPASEEHEALTDATTTVYANFDEMADSPTYV